MTVAGLHVERGEQRGRAVPLVVVGAPLGLAGPHRQQAAACGRAPGSGDFSSTHSTTARSGGDRVEPDDVAHLLHEQRIGRQLEGLDYDAAAGRRRCQMRWMVDGAWPIAARHRPQAPVRRSLRARLQRLADRVGDLIVADLPRRARTRLVVEPVQPSRRSDRAICQPCPGKSPAARRSGRCAHLRPPPAQYALAGPAPGQSNAGAPAIPIPVALPAPTQSPMLCPLPS